MKRHDPLFNVTASTKPVKRTSLVSAHGTPPTSPIDKSRMVISNVTIGGKKVPVWVDKKNRIVYPTQEG